ncbi:MAG: glycosyltransferase family 9 protein [Burkholderiales bacterium]
MRPVKILVIRRDNIGDLVLTLPLIRAIRERFPDGWIAALVNTYNAPVLEGSPWLDAVYAYQKFKHAGPASLPATAVRDVRLVMALRAQAVDYAVLAGSGLLPRALRLARFCGARHIVGFVPSGQPCGAIDVPVEFGSAAGLHEVQDVFRLGRAFGIEGEAPAAFLQPNAAVVSEIHDRLRAKLGGAHGPTVGVHISARKPSQRWPVERFVAFMRAMKDAGTARFLLFWSPGAADHRQHPGDDAKASELLEALRDFPVIACETRRLTELVAGLSLCDRVVCSDGGAMHIAAALGKPILCFFGNSPAERFHPWGVPYVLLQPPSLEVRDISAEQAIEGFERLQDLTRGAQAQASS